MTSLEECQPFKSLWQICSWEQHVLCLKHTKPVPGLHQYIKWIIKYDCAITMTHLFNSIRMWRVHMRRLFWKSGFLLQKQVRHACSLDQLRDAHGKTDLHFTEASRRHSQEKWGPAPAAWPAPGKWVCSTEGRKGIRNSLFPEKLPKEHLSWDKLSAPAGRFHTLCCWKTFYTLLPCNELTCVSLKLRC